MAEVVFIGTGEAVDPDVPNTSVLVLASGALLVDCGYSVPQGLWRQTQDPELLDAVYLTHAHADHSFGLPALLLWMRFNGRRRALDILGGPGAKAWTRRILDLGYPGAFAPDKCFPLRFHEVLPGSSCRVKGMALRSAASEHSVDNHALRVDDAEFSVGISGDGAPTRATEGLFRGVDLLIHESFSCETPIKGHATAKAVVELAERTAAELALVHAAAHERDSLRRWVRTTNPAVPTFVPRPGHLWTKGPTTGRVDRRSGSTP